jgi:hypothetical protein
VEQMQWSTDGRALQDGHVWDTATRPTCREALHSQLGVKGQCHWELISVEVLCTPVEFSTHVTTSHSPALPNLI